MTVQPIPCLIPGPASCLGPQLTPSACPHHQALSHPSCQTCLCAPPPLHPTPVGRPSLPWFPRHSRMPHTIGTRSGDPQKESRTEAGVGVGAGETERKEYPLFLLKQEVRALIGRRAPQAAENPVPLAATAQPSPDKPWHASFLLPAPPPAGGQWRCWRGGGPEVGALAVNVDDSCFP